MLLRFRSSLLILRRQAPRFLLVVYLERALIANGEGREQVLEMADLGADSDRDGVDVPGVQDGGRQLDAVVGVDLVRSRVGVDELKHAAGLDGEDTRTDSTLVEPFDRLGPRRPAEARASTE